MRSLHVIGLLALASCNESAADNFAKPPPAAALAVELAAVTLADDCPPVPATPAKPSDEAVPAKPGRAAPGSRGHCNQTSMQLVIKAPSGAEAMVKVKKVELLDDKGKLLEVLTPRAPRTWAANGQYVAWDERLTAGKTVQAMYDLTMPDWNKLTGGRWNAHTRAFQVRVTVAIGGANKTVEKQSITPVRLPPAVPT
jgi:hypothetical protein